MPRIVETIVTTQNAAGEEHIAPLGLIEDGEGWIIAPFSPSRTLEARIAAVECEKLRVFRPFSPPASAAEGWPCAG